jgi:glycosyltransferase involved in cell wall biosynthesis
MNRDNAFIDIEHLSDAMDCAPDEFRAQTQTPGPTVSVVIPTRDRPGLVVRAVRGALAQTLREIEVIVVVDGPDAATQRALDEVRDRRLHVLCLDRSVGGSEARNMGAHFARGEWVALLDDDDEWLPGKLAAQWHAAKSLTAARVVVGCRFLERTESAERVLPRRMPGADEPFSDYMFARRGWKSGEGFLQTSTWFVSRRLLREVPFTPGLKRCQDLDWLLRATARPETEVVIVPEVLAVFHHEDRGGRVSRSSDWKFLYRWAVANRRLFTSKAFAFFIATFCVPSAAKQGEGLRTFVFLMRRCVMDGVLDAKCLTLFLVCWFVPEARRRSLRASAEHFPLARTGGSLTGIHQLSAGRAR